MRDSITKKTVLGSLTIAGAIFAICAALGLGFIQSDLAHAEESVGSDGWKVTFDGKSMESNFADGRFDDKIAGMQPGDVVSFNVDLDNTADGSTDWYMSNKVLKTLEETQQPAEGGAYTYRLTYINPQGQEEVLYDSNIVGGEKGAGSLEGLHESTSALKDFFLLDRLQNGDSGSVKLDIALDGETQGNVYQDTFAQLQLNFAAEPIELNASSSSSSSSSNNPPKIQANVGRLQQTGDEMLPWMYIFAGVGVCGLILLIIALVKSRRSEEER